MEKLKKDNLNMIETIALSVAIIAPTAAMALNISLMAQTAGYSSPLIFLISTIVVGLVSYTIIKFNHYISSAGSLYSFTKKALGNKMGFTSGWALLLAYVTLGAGTSAGCGAFFSQFLAAVFGVNISWLPLTLIFSIVMIFLGTTDAKISTRLMLTMEGISIILILILSFVVLFKVATTTGLSVVPFKTNGVSVSALASTSVFAFLSFIGFESASSLGEETKNPKKFIPIAIGSAVFVTGLFYLISSYSQVVGFGIDAKGLKAISASSLPLSDLANKYMSKGYGTLLLLSAALSFFSCGLGSACAGARMLFSMSRDGIIPTKLGKVHGKYNTPYVALIIIIVASMIMEAALFMKSGTDVFGYYATIGSLAILVSYIFTSIGGMVYFTKRKIWGALNLVVPILSIVALLYVLVANIYPVPEFPNNIFPYIVLGWIAIGFVLSHIFGNNAVSEIDAEDDVIEKIN
ncbi:amino acid/polyamine/organocation transporter, APC superfamily (TC 2.A.3) [Clostridium acidisoli DSM 12555]|uniref:Amino acid/polyamine/organocation transporter, APC superfamily (TC 2.A.3) n=1 Tax=Clostridium acidisoli DSM 12555 TaxID=1121291 RepID=A0A1W1XH36_9CLOT|nr:APC family permease [Clostridium acidisoli]SMC23269.1 amino acid/polyamine/organocation transporter, APC superfamily (TC 2.A.3) [Clostridium acidisoli DSM 12555]